MPAVVFYFHVHQPFRIKPYPLFSIGEDRSYFETDEIELDNKRLVRKVAQKCYLPVNDLLFDLIKRIPSFKISFSISGLVLEQFEAFAPEVIESFKALVETGNVEMVNDTYYHSLAFVYSKKEFVEQVTLHQQKLEQVFGIKTKAFRNTELIYNNEVAQIAEEMGFSTILAEGVDRYLGWRSPNFVYQPKETKKIKLLLKNYKFSDDIAFRFSDRNWSGWPLTAKKFAGWISDRQLKDDVVNLFMDYETFGEHQWSDTGILDFLRELPKELVARNTKFMTVSEAADSFVVKDEVDMPEFTSWADTERDLSAWLGNPLQRSAAQAIFDMEKEILASSDTKLVDDWRKLTTSDHFYYMSTKHDSDGEVHKYFSPNGSAFDAYNNFMHVLHDLRQRVYTAS